MSVAEQLPPELLTRIFEFIRIRREDVTEAADVVRLRKETLSACALVHSSWRDPAQRLLFHRHWLAVNDGKLLKTLATTHAVAMSTCELFRVGPSSPYYSDRNDIKSDPYAYVTSLNQCATTLIDALRSSAHKLYRFEITISDDWPHYCCLNKATPISRSDLPSLRDFNVRLLDGTDTPIRLSRIVRTLALFPFVDDIRLDSSKTSLVHIDNAAKLDMPGLAHLSDQSIRTTRHDWTTSLGMHCFTTRTLRRLISLTAEDPNLWCRLAPYVRSPSLYGDYRDFSIELFTQFPLVQEIDSPLACNVPTTLRDILYDWPARLRQVTCVLMNASSLLTVPLADVRTVFRERSLSLTRIFFANVATPENLDAGSTATLKAYEAELAKLGCRLDWHFREPLPA